MRKQTLIFIVGACCLLGILISVAILWQISSTIVMDVINTPVPLPTFASGDVQYVCQIFGLSNDDAFCDASSSQDAYTFEETLHEHFPPYAFTHADIMALLGDLPSRPSMQCYGQLEHLDFVAGFCPPPEECNGSYRIYSCSFLLPDSIQMVVVDFDSATGSVLDYGVPKPGT